MTQSVGLLMEGLVAVLLLITIGFCVILNRKISLLRADEHMLRTTITELNKTTVRAETAIKGLRAIAADANEALGEQMKEAERLARDLARGNAHGEDMLRRMGGAGRKGGPARGGAQHQAPPPPQQAERPRQPAPPAPQSREPARHAAPGHRVRAA